MTRVILNAMILTMLVCSLSLSVLAQNTVKQAPPAWIQRGQRGAAQAELERLVGTWRVELSIYGTMGRSADLPPIVSRDIKTTRTWTADGYYLEDTTEGTVD